jgi:hypothetical protein
MLLLFSLPSLSCAPPPDQDHGHGEWYHTSRIDPPVIGNDLAILTWAEVEHRHTEERLRVPILVLLVRRLVARLTQRKVPGRKIIVMIDIVFMAELSLKAASTMVFSAALSISTSRLICVIVSWSLYAAKSPSLSLR